jgi:hypothetical protein
MTMYLRLLCVVILIAGASQTVPGKPRWQECLPADVSADEVIGVEQTDKNQTKKEITVKSKLSQLGARCRGKRLVDARGRQIQFYRLTGCWGNPPENYQEIMDNQQRELAQLRKRFRVVEISCNPSGVLIQ